jgi:hypothetical protein
VVVTLITTAKISSSTDTSASLTSTSVDAAEASEPESAKVVVAVAMPHPPTIANEEELMISPSLSRDAFPPRKTEDATAIARTVIVTLSVM